MAVIQTATGAISQLGEFAAIGAHFPDAALLQVIGYIVISFKNNPHAIGRPGRLNIPGWAVMVGDRTEVGAIGGDTPQVIGLQTVGGEDNAVVGGIPGRAGQVDVILILPRSQSSGLPANQI